MRSMASAGSISCCDGQSVESGGVGGGLALGTRRCGSFSGSGGELCKTQHLARPQET